MEMNSDGCHFAIWSTLHRILNFSYLLTALRNVKQQSYWLIYSG